ncbi:MAG TPA: methanogenesis marker 17 protein [Methanosarcinales archaeon]|nr:MAG: methanogenesis marker 17 protein [Methanosarcinales archaeon]HDN65727.1 methanogenesis marker 17 protein [Methanosarcinales archaeon]
MLPLEVFRVESPDKTGAEAYESVIRDVLADLELTTVLGRLWVHIDPTEPVFFFCTLIRTGLPPICVKDMADISTGTQSAKQVELKLTNEEHVSTLLSILWIEYGRENVSQPERLVITIDTEDKDRVAKDLADVVIADPRREIESRLADALLRITPEGFRVRHHVSTGSEMLFVASEDSIKHEWVKKAEDMMDQLKGDL